MTKSTKAFAGILFVAAIVAGSYFWYSQQKKETPVCLNGQTEIYEKYKSAVVLVRNAYELEFSVKGSKPFTISVEGNTLGTDTIYGTGFFISSKGKIVTNHHVSEPWLYEDTDVTDYMKDHIAEILPDSIPLDEIKAFLEKNWSTETDEENEEQTSKQSNATAAIPDPGMIGPSQDTIVATPSTKEYTKVYRSEVQIHYRSTQIAIALHGSVDEWLDCSYLKADELQEVDVAILQLQSKKLPASVSDVILLNNAVLNDATLKPGSKAIMIGYPMGLTLANTNQGVKVQVYEGQINKESDGMNLQYNITSTHGASGSPVFNECGQLIAINYAGFDEAQGYNFGIAAKYACRLAD